MGFRVAGRDFHGRLVMVDRLVEPPAAGQGKTEVVVGRRVVGLDFQGLLVLLDGLIDPPAASQRNTKVVSGLLRSRA